MWMHPCLIPKRDPCGTRLVRLRDIPFEQRLAALRELVKEGLPDGEAEVLLGWVYEPGDLGARVA